MTDANALKADRARLLQLLEDEGISYQEAIHPAVYTMADSALLNLALPGTRCKNLLLQDKKGLNRILLVTFAEVAVDLAALGRTLGVGRLSLCPPDEMRQLLGTTPGSLSPFALLADGSCRIRLVMDERLRTTSHFMFHPLENTSTVAVGSDGLARFLAAIGHRPDFIDIPMRISTAQTS